MAALDADDLMLCVSGIGSTNAIDGQRVYVPGEECLACLADLQRYLRRDNPKDMAAHKQLGEWAVVKMHLLPMLLSQAHDDKLVFNLLKLLVKLSMPVSPEAADAKLQEAIDIHKEAFAGCPEAIRVIMRLLCDPLRRSANGGADAEDENVFIELVLTLFRNLMHSPPPDASPPGPAQVRAFQRSIAAHERILAVLEAEHVLEVVLYVTQLLSESSATRSWNLMLLEVVYCVVAFTDPDEVIAAAAKSQPAASALGADGARARVGVGVGAQRSAGNSRLAELLAREKAARTATIVSSTVRHSNFGGAYESKSAFGSEAVIGKVRQDGSAALKEAVKGKRAMKKHAPIIEERAHVSVGATRACSLLGFARRMLRGPLVSLCLTVRKDLVDATFGSTSGNARRVLPADYVYFTAVSAWFCDVHRALELQRLKEAARSGGSAAGAEGGGADEASRYFNVTPVAVSCELPCWQMGLRLARQHQEAKEWLKLGVVVRYLKSLVQVVNEMEARGGAESRRVARALLQNVFYEGEMIPLLRELLKAYEPYQMGASYLRDAIELTHVTLRQLESYGKKQGGIVLQRRKNVRKRKSAAAKAAAKAQAAQEAAAAAAKAVLEANEMGASQDECEALEAAAADAALAASAASAEAAAAAAANDDDGDDIDVAVVEEVALDFERSLAELMTNAVVWKYCLALKTWRTNPPATNHHVAKFLHRVMCQCKLEPVLWQVSVLQIAHDVLTDRQAHAKEEHKEVRALCNRIASGFLDAAAASPVLVVEALFWKKHSECEELRGGYANARQRAAERQAMELAAQQRAVFGEAERGEVEDEGEGAHAGSGDEEGAQPAEGEGEGEEAEGEGGEEGEEKAERRRRRKEPWTAEEDEVLTDNYELYADSDEVYELLAGMLDGRTPKSVKKRVKQLGLKRKAARRERATAHGAHGEAGAHVPLVVVGGEEGSSDDEDDVLRRGAKRRFAADDDADAAPADLARASEAAGEDEEADVGFQGGTSLGGAADEDGPDAPMDELAMQDDWHAAAVCDADSTGARGARGGGEEEEEAEPLSAHRHSPLAAAANLSAARTARRPSNEAPAAGGSDDEDAPRAKSRAAPARELAAAGLASAAVRAGGKRQRVVSESDDDDDAGGGSSRAAAETGADLGLGKLACSHGRAAAADEPALTAAADALAAEDDSDDGDDPEMDALLARHAASLSASMQV